MTLEACQHTKYLDSMLSGSRIASASELRTFMPVINDDVKSGDLQLHDIHTMIY
jgi:hypothetical protein